MIFQVQSKSYTGPMDLLLDLVSQSKIDIYDINISQITEQFLEAMQEIDVPVEELSDFIRMASFLVLMKARILIQDQNEEEEEVPSREEFIRRLKEYQIYQYGAGRLKDQWEKASLILRKLPEDPLAYQEEKELPLASDPQALKKAIWALFDQKNRKDDRTLELQAILDHQDDSIEEVAKFIQKKLLTGKHFTFHDLMDGLRWTKPRMIAAFLSLLEISRKDSIRLTQDQSSKVIEVEVVNAGILEKTEEFFPGTRERKAELDE